MNSLANGKKMEIVDIFHSKYTKYGISQCMYVCIYICKSRMTWTQMMRPVGSYQQDVMSPWFQFQKVERIPFPNEWTSSRHILASQPLHEPLPPRFFSPLKRLFIRKSLHAQPHGNSPAARTGGVTGVVWFSWLSWISGSLDIVMSGLLGMLPAIFHDGFPLGPEWNLRECLGLPNVHLNTLKCKKALVFTPCLETSSSRIQCWELLANGRLILFHFWKMPPPSKKKNDQKVFFLSWCTSGKLVQSMAP